MNLYNFVVKNSNEEDVSLEQYRNKVTLVVNVASRCGFTPQYSALQNLYSQYKDQGFIVLGFPCNQFGSQEPGSNSEIQDFCSQNYGVSFPVFAKIEVNGSEEHPLYHWLKEEAPGIFGTEMIKWNFTKFLVGKDGKVIKRYAPQADPKDLKADIEAALSL